MTDLGAVHRRTAAARAAGTAMPTVPRNRRSTTTDRYGRELGRRNAQGRAYEVCPMCGQRASVRYRVQGRRVWRCEHCGYADSMAGPLN